MPIEIEAYSYGGETWINKISKEEYDQWINYEEGVKDFCETMSIRGRQLHHLNGILKLDFNLNDSKLFENGEIFDYFYTEQTDVTFYWVYFGITGGYHSLTLDINDVNDFDEEQIIFNKDQDILDSITYDGNSNHILKSVKIERPYGVFCCGTKVI